MTATWTRRDVLKTIAATASSPVLAHAAPPRRTVAIIGAGMAGVSVAWLLDGQRDVVLLESRDSIGGNVRTLDVELDGHHFAVDMGAQFFHPGPYPVYTALLKSLDLFPPDVAAPPPSRRSRHRSRSRSPSEATPRFVSPIIPTRLWPIVRGLEPAWPPGVLHRLQRRECARTERRELVAHAGRLAADTRSVAGAVGRHHPAVGGVAVFGRHRAGARHVRARGHVVRREGAARRSDRAGRVLRPAETA